VKSLAFIMKKSASRAESVQDGSRGLGATADPAGRTIAASEQADDSGFDRLFRPTSLDEYVGQEHHKSNLRVFIEAARRRKEPLDHILFCGPPGLGKTTLAYIIAREMGVAMHATAGPAVEHKGALAGLLTKLQPNDVLFIDEIHRLSPTVEESLYPAIEDFKIDITTGDGPYAATYELPIPAFTLIGATTRTGLLTAPLLSRFGYVMRLDFYPVEDLAKIIHRSARMLSTPIDDAGADELAQRSRGTPRVANRLLRTIIDTYDGGPVGVETLAAALSEPRDTIEDVYEPYLLQIGMLGRTPRGRVATRKAYLHLGREPNHTSAGADPNDEKTAGAKDSQGSLF